MKIIKKIAYIIILISLLGMLNNAKIQAREVGTEFDKRDEGVIKGLEKQRKSSGSSGTSVNLDALGKEINNVSGSSSAIDAINKVIGIVEIAIVTAAIIVILTKGVSFMQAAPEGKADIKKQMIAVIIGGIIIFSITGIIQLIINVGTKIFK